MGRNDKAMAELAEWMKRFERAASPAFQKAQSVGLAKITLKEIEEGFRTETTPTRKKWDGKKNPNGEQILVETGDMRRGFRAKIAPGQFKIVNIRKTKNGRVLAHIHQKGYPPNNLPRRQMWPDSGKLPIKWIRLFRRETEARFHRVIAAGKKR